MKKIIELIKKLLSGGSMAEKVAELNELETAVVSEVKVVEDKVAEVKAKVKAEVAVVEEKVAEVKAKVKKATTKAPNKAK